VPQEVTRCSCRSALTTAFDTPALSSPGDDAAEIEPQMRELEHGRASSASLTSVYAVASHTDEYYESGSGDGALRPYRICFQ